MSYYPDFDFRTDKLVVYRNKKDFLTLRPEVATHRILVLPSGTFTVSWPTPDDYPTILTPMEQAERKN